jgi:hypothetical protein
MFVANRTELIKDSTNIANWRWVDTHNNPADIGSRGMLLEDLLKEEQWWSGPGFLRLGRDAWPVEKTPLTLTEEGLLELKRVKDEHGYSAKESNWSFPFGRCGNWSRLVRATAIMLKFKRKGLNFVRKLKDNVTDLPIRPDMGAVSRLVKLEPFQCREALREDYINAEDYLEGKKEIFKQIQHEVFGQPNKANCVACNPR